MSHNLNRCEFIGNLTRDPEIRYTPSGAAVVDFGIAVNESYKKNDEWVDEAVFINLQAWNKVAENISTQYKKGDRIYVSGKFKLDTWEDKNTGEKRSAPRFTIFSHWGVAKPVKSDSAQNYQNNNDNDNSDEDEDLDDIPF